MNEDLRRAFAFVATGYMGGVRSEVSRYGLAVFDEALPLRYDSNYLLVDELPNAVSPDDLAREARRLDRPAIMVRDERTGERLVRDMMQISFEGVGSTRPATNVGWRAHGECDQPIGPG